MLISNLKTTNSLKVCMGSFLASKSLFSLFYFFYFFFIDLNSFSDVLSFNSLSILVHPPEPTKVAVSIPSPGANKSGSFNSVPWSQQQWQFQFPTLQCECFVTQISIHF